FKMALMPQKQLKILIKLFETIFLVLQLYKKWFQKFNEKNKNLKNEDCGKPCFSVNNDELRAVVEADLRQTVRQLAEVLNVSKSTVSQTIIILFWIELLRVMKSEFCTIIARKFAGKIIYYEFLKHGETITAQSYCRRIKKMHQKLCQRRSALVNRKGSILFYGNAKTHVLKKILRKLNFVLRDSHFFKYLDRLSNEKIFNNEEDIKLSLKISLLLEARISIIIVKIKLYLCKYSSSLWRQICHNEIVLDLVNKKVKLKFYSSIDKLNEVKLSIPKGYATISFDFASAYYKPATLISIYLSGWNKWIKCCEKQGIDSEILEKSHLTNFLAEETKDKTASTVNLIKATVLKIFTLVNKPIEQENLLDHIIKDIHNVKKNKLKIEQYEIVYQKENITIIAITTATLGRAKNTEKSIPYHKIIIKDYYKTYNMRAGRKVLFISTRQPFRELTVDRIKNNIKEYLTEAKGGNNACECKSAAISNDFWNKMSLEQLMEEEQTLNDLPRSRNPKIVHTKQNIQKVKENEEESMEIPLAVQSQELVMKLTFIKMLNLTSKIQDIRAKKIFKLLSTNPCILKKSPFFWPKKFQVEKICGFSKTGRLLQTASGTIDFFKTNFENRLISTGGKNEWLARSSDISPSDFFLVYKNRPITLNVLKDNIDEEIQKNW
uniref:Uncharacterized protein n=1 Tax=Strongyloides stercoralis TaxID=6248 RepID=A0AAF5I4N8_STRER